MSNVLVNPATIESLAETRLRTGLASLSRVRNTPDQGQLAKPSVELELFFRYLRSEYHPTAAVGAEQPLGFDRDMRFEAYVEVQSLLEHTPALNVINLAVGLLTAWIPDMDGIKEPMRPLTDAFVQSRGTGKFTYKADFGILTTHAPAYLDKDPMAPIPIPGPITIRAGFWRSPIDEIAEPSSTKDRDVIVTLS